MKSVNARLTFVLFCLFLFLPFLSYSQIQLGSDLDGEAAGDWSGWYTSQSSDGNRIAIGAPFNDGTGNTAGHVRVFDWDGNNWIQFGSDIDGESAGNWCGNAISMSSDGNRMAVGAPYNDGTGNNAGHVRVFDWDGNNWTQVGSDIDGEAISDQSGTDVSMSSAGDRVAIGAPYNDDAGSNAGQVKVYEWSGTQWNQLGGDIDGEAAGDLSGFRISLSADGTRVAIGAIHNDGGGNDAGHVRIYNWNGTQWAQMGADINGAAGGDNLSYGLSINAAGNRVAIGATGNDDSGANAGHVQVYEWNGIQWIQLGSDIDGEAAADAAGRSVSLSDNGNVLAIGATLNDGAGNAAGHVRIFQWNGSTWSQVGTDIDGESAGDSSGLSVNISSDGSRVVIGAVTNDGAGTEAGPVRVYDISSALPVELLHFLATRIDHKYIELRWKTATEIQNLGFEIQRSADGLQWQKLRFLAGEGNSQEMREYTFVDYNPFNNYNYYRLKQIDLDGGYGFSPIRVINFQNRFYKSLSFYPNPATDQLSMEQPYSGHAIIIDSMGKVLKRVTISAEQSVIDVADLPSGSYLLKLLVEDGSTVSGRFLK